MNLLPSSIIYYNKITNLSSFCSNWFFIYRKTNIFLPFYWHIYNKNSKI